MYSTKRAKIFSFIFENGGCSRGDIERGIVGMKINCVCGRVNELIACGAVYEKGCKHDELSGRSVNRLYVTRRKELVSDADYHAEQH
jgi:hypothetical protein